jgi:hypothetical protein
MPLYAAMQDEITETFRKDVLAQFTRQELLDYLVPAIRALLAPPIVAAEAR